MISIPIVPQSNHSFVKHKHQIPISIRAPNSLCRRDGVMNGTTYIWLHVDFTSMRIIAADSSPLD